MPLPPEMEKYIRDYDRYKGQPGYEQNPYEKYPEVELEELTETVVREVNDADAMTVIVVNICNPDMVGHTGSMRASIACVRAVDAALRRLADALLAAGGIMLITADHGNIEELLTDGRPNTYHTRAKVPFALLGLPERTLRGDGTLKDVAPTVLYLLHGEEKAEVRQHLPGRILFKE